MYLGIDPHARQLTVALRDDHGDVLLARQVSAPPERAHAFFRQLIDERRRAGETFVAVLEVCGVNGRRIRLLHDYRCRQVILIQPDERQRCQTDRRDAAALGELLWANRERLLRGKPVRGLRRVEIASATDQENRRLTAPRQEAGGARTRRVNQVRQIRRRHHRQWDMPTPTFPTVAAIAWLRGLALPEIDRLEMGHLLADLEQVEQRLKGLEQVIARRAAVSAEVKLLSAMPGAGGGFTAAALAGRAGRVERSPRARSRANYWGLTPGCRNSGASDQRLGRITKAGSSTARRRPAQLVHKVLRRDARPREWFRRRKRRRGSAGARVAVLRKLATILWHMPRTRKTYAGCRELALA